MPVNTRAGSVLEDRLLLAAVILLAAVSIGGMASSWTALSATIDEPTHIWCGVEWLQNGICAFDLQHPPLARMVVGIGPYLHGARSPGHWSRRRRRRC